MLSLRLDLCAAVPGKCCGAGSGTPGRPWEVVWRKPVSMWLAVVLACAGGSGLGADEPPARVEVGESIDVRVVNVEAVATDPQDHVVHGLAAPDFQLLVDGKEVPIDYFTEVRDGQAAVAAAPAAAATPQPAGAPGAVTAAPAPEGAAG